jgi:glycosyltransferase involved in cell wall biosynthesis
VTSGGSKRRLRVLHVLSGCTVGGCEQHVLALLARLDRERYEPWLACFEAEPDAATPMIPMFRAAGVRTIDLRARRRTDPAAFARFGKLLRRGHFDIVHVHSFRTELGATLLGRVLGGSPRLIRTAHNVDEFYVSPRYGVLSQISAKGLDRVVAISDAVGDYLRDEAGLPGEKIVRIYYGVDPTPYRPEMPPPSRRPKSDPTSRPTLGVLARLAPQKGHRVLFDALPEIAQAIPDVRIRVVGHEEQSTVAELRAYAEQRGVADLVEFEGFCGDVAGLLADLDLMVLPSLWEGFGLVLLEAMAAGRPVVASAVGPIPEIVVDGATGLLVPPGDPKALAKAIVRVLADPDLAAALGRAGRARVEGEFGLETMVARTEELYEQLVRKAS